MKLPKALIKQLAGRIDKTYLLGQLKAKWEPTLKGTNFDIDRKVDEVKKNIKKLGFGYALEVVGITDEDIKKVLEEI